MDFDKNRVEQVKEWFKKDKFVEYSGIKILSVDAEKAVVSAKVEAWHLNANGCVQGGMLYTVADFAFAVLANYLHPATVTQGGHINYVKAAYCKTLTATATETVRVGHNCLSEVVIKNEDGEIVCVCNFNGFVKEIQ